MNKVTGQQNLDFGWAEGSNRAYRWLPPPSRLNGKRRVETRTCLVRKKRRNVRPGSDTTRPRTTQRDPPMRFSRKTLTNTRADETRWFFQHALASRSRHQSNASHIFLPPADRVLNNAINARLGLAAIATRWAWPACRSSWMTRARMTNSW